MIEALREGGLSAAGEPHMFDIRLSL